MTQPLIAGLKPNDADEEPQEVRPTAPLPSYVLLVDDEPAIRHMLTRWLQDWGYATKHAGSAAQALEMMRAEEASLVLCDIKMPGEDGLCLAEQLHTHWPRIPIIMVTALEDPETVRQSRRVGAVDFITKPITQDRLLQALRQATSTPDEAIPSSEDPTWSSGEPHTPDHGAKSEAEYRLEYPVRCPACGARLEILKAVRLIRAQVNFTSTLPRRGRVLTCPHCLAIVPAELSNF
jgi:CheY-like chemotaxis protein